MALWLEQDADGRTVRLTREEYEDLMDALAFLFVERCRQQRVGFGKKWFVARTRSEHGAVHELVRHGMFITVDQGDTSLSRSNPEWFQSREVAAR